MSSRRRKPPATVIEGASFDRDHSRFVYPCLDGLACYRGITEASGEWRGKLIGFAETLEDAQRFLNGELVVLRPPADPDAAASPSSSTPETQYNDQVSGLKPPTEP